MAPVVKSPPANAGDIRDVSSIPGSERPAGERHGNPLQYLAWIMIPMIRGTWRAIVYRVTKSQTCMKWLSMHTGTDCSPPGSSVHGISQKRILEYVAIFFSRGSFQPRNLTHVSCFWQVGYLPLVPPGKPPLALLKIRHFKYYNSILLVRLYMQIVSVLYIFYFRAITHNFKTESICHPFFNIHIRDVRFFSSNKSS